MALNPILSIPSVYPAGGAIMPEIEEMDTRVPNFEEALYKHSRLNVGSSPIVGV